MQRSACRPDIVAGTRASRAHARTRVGSLRLLRFGLPRAPRVCAHVAILALIAALPLPAAQPAIAEGQGSGAVFAVMGRNEWCPGGSVYLDLQTGAFMLYPRLTRSACSDRTAPLPVERGTLPLVELQRVRSAYQEARRIGLSRDKCEVVISNGGPQMVVITAPGFSARTPEQDGCWSEGANRLHAVLFEVFGKQRQPGRSR
jgi:hypothetical protein